MRLPEITIRAALDNDLDDIVRIADTFFTYGGFDAEDYDRDIFRETARLSLLSNEAVCLLACHNNDVVGYYAAMWCSMYSKKPIMYETHFAVLPEYRLSSAGRDLTKAIIDYGEFIGVKTFYAGSTSGIKAFDNSVLNMYTKCGMTPSGAMMRFNYE